MQHNIQEKSLKSESMSEVIKLVQERRINSNSKLALVPSQFKQCDPYVSRADNSFVNQSLSAFSVKRSPGFKANVQALRMSHEIPNRYNKESVAFEMKQKIDRFRHLIKSPEPTSVLKDDSLHFPTLSPKPVQGKPSQIQV